MEADRQNWHPVPKEVSKGGAEILLAGNAHGDQSEAFPRRRIRGFPLTCARPTRGTRLVSRTSISSFPGKGTNSTPSTRYARAWPYRERARSTPGRATIGGSKRVAALDSVGLRDPPSPARVPEEGFPGDEPLGIGGGRALREL